MKQRIDSVARQVSHHVTRGRTVAAHPPVRVSARELTIEFDPEPYPEVPAAFEEFCRVTGTNGRLVGYNVRPVVGEDEITARVTATVEIGSASFIGHGVDEDVVAGSVHAFAGAIAQRI
jgi:LeuA allosteric (dimerisation) domain